MFKPTINSNFKVIPRINPQLGNNLDHAIFNDDQMVQINVDRENLVPDNMNYNVDDLVLRFLNDEGNQ